MTHPYSGMTIEYRYNGEIFVAKGHKEHSAETCLSVTQQLIAEPEVKWNAATFCIVVSYNLLQGSFAKTADHPKIAKSQPVYILSYYFDRYRHDYAIILLS